MLVVGVTFGWEEEEEVDREEKEACRGYFVAGEELGWWRRLGRSWS